MAQVYGGLVANTVAPAATNIASSTNASPIVITTSTNHLLMTGDTVTIAKHQTNTTANGTPITVTVLSATTFSIPVAGVGVGGATGTVQLLSRGAAGTIYSDGDPVDSLHINPTVVPAIDRTALLLQSTGSMKLADRRIAIAAANSASATQPWAHIAAGSVTAGVAAQFTSDGRAWGMAFGSSIGTGLPTSAGVAPIFQFPVTANDLVMARLDTTVNFPAKARLALYTALTVPGAAAPTWPGGYALNAGSTASGDGASGTPVRTAVSVPLILFVPYSGVLYIQPVFLPQFTSGGTSPELDDDATLTFECWRSTGWPQ